MDFKVNIKSNTPLFSEIIFDSGSITEGRILEHLTHLNRTSNHFLFTDINVLKFYGRKIIEQLESSNFKIKLITLEPSELSKSMECYNNTLEYMLSVGLDKKSHIICLGGGVVSNLAGFVASTLCRGIGFINIPTTSLAQVDSAIDFKQAINSKFGKNLIGSLYPAKKIIIDPETLSTLDVRNYNNGFAESIKHALAQDRAYFSKLLEFGRSKSKDSTLSREIIKRSIDLKIDVMNDYLDDPLMYKEMTKQYGHSIGHAIEHVSNGEILHGEAISIGMYISSIISVNKGYANNELIDDHRVIFEAYDLPYKLPDNLDISSVMNTIKYDKHFLGKPKMMLLESIGVPKKINDTYELQVELDELEAALLKSRE